MAGLIFSSILKNCDTSYRRLVLGFGLVSAKTSGKRSLLIVCGLSSLFLLSCHQPVMSTTESIPKSDRVPNMTEPLVPQPNIQAKASLAQFLPITATAAIAGRKVDLEVTRTIPEQAKGLMYRPALPVDRGMLFNFTPARPVAFWMKNCIVSLDMVFILAGKVVAISNSSPPCKTEPCPVYPAEGVVVDSVIELRAGWAKEMGLKVRDRVTVTAKK